MRLPKRPINALRAALVGLAAMFLGTTASAIPVSAIAMDGGSVSGATTTILLYLTGPKTSGALDVPLNDGITAKKDVKAMCHYGQAYAVKWTLKKGGTTVDTRATVLNQTTLQPAGSDTWNIDLDTIGAGYGEYTLTCVVEGSAKDTNTSTFKYLPIKYTETGKNANGQPMLTLAYEAANITRVRFTIKKSGRSDVVIVKGLTNAETSIILGLSDYDLPTGTYTVIAEGGNASSWLGNTYQSTISYTKPAGSGTPSMDADHGLGVVGAAAAGAVITGASSSKKKRNRN